MRKYITILAVLAVGMLLFALPGCYKDKGNYTYNMPEEPTIKGLDSVYNVFVGDSLIIDPEITLPSSSSLSFEWRISVPNPDLKDVVDSGRAMRVIFGLGAERYYGRLTVINNDNGMKYFRYFIVAGKTAFSTGTTVLSSEDGKTHLSFIKPNGEVQARVFEAVNPDVPLPEQPTQLVAVPEAYQPGTVKTYWVFGKSGVNTGIRVNANTFQFDRALRDHFFDPPAEIIPGRFFPSSFGVIVGVVNNRLIAGETRTWDQAPIFGMFPLTAPGDYTLSSEIIYTDMILEGYSSFTGYDTEKKQFVRLGVPSDAVYFGTAYEVLGAAFDPKNVGMEMVKLLKINGGMGYAYMLQGGTLRELKFITQFNTNSGEPISFNALQNRVFSRPELIKPNTLWTATRNEIIYFSSGDKVYRYNPGNEDFRELATSFGGKEITLLKAMDNNTTLMVGVEGSISYLNIATGSNGELLQKFEGIPGKPIDIAFR